MASVLPAFLYLWLAFARLAVRSVAISSSAPSANGLNVNLTLADPRLQALQPDDMVCFTQTQLNTPLDAVSTSLNVIQGLAVLSTFPYNAHLAAREFSFPDHRDNKVSLRPRPVDGKVENRYYIWAMGGTWINMGPDAANWNFKVSGFKCEHTGVPGLIFLTVTYNKVNGDPLPLTMTGGQDRTSGSRMSALEKRITSGLQTGRQPGNTTHLDYPLVIADPSDNLEVRLYARATGTPIQKRDVFKTCIKTLLFVCEIADMKLERPFEFPELRDDWQLKFDHYHRYARESPPFWTVGVTKRTLALLPMIMAQDDVWESTEFIVDVQGIPVMEGQLRPRRQ